MTRRLESLKLEQTGNAAFDSILGGGIPSRSLTVIAGEPGSGKTVFMLQLLFHAARRGQKCIYFTTLSEPAMKLIRYMQQFSFFDAALVENHIRFFDLGDAIRAGMEQTMSTISKHVESFDPQWVVIDSFRAIDDIGATPRRAFVYDLAVQLATWSATTFLVGEYSREDIATFPEFAIADGIIRIGREHQGLASVRELEIFKMRGANYTTGTHFCRITEDGLSVCPRVQTPSSYEPESVSVADRDLMGVVGLDELLAGGLPRTSSTIIQGASGTGKTLLGLHFLLEGARHGERGILFTHEETVEQLRAIATGLEWDLATLEREGLLIMRHVSPIELSPDYFLFRVRELVQQVGARRVVFDSLTTMALSVQSERRLRELVYAVGKHMRVARVTSVMTAEMLQQLGSAHLAGGGFSLFADNLIQLRYVEIDGRIERAISVIKVRGVKQLTELRSFSIEVGGVKVNSGGFKDMQGVLTGAPTRSGSA